MPKLNKRKSSYSVEVSEQTGSSAGDGGTQTNVAAEEHEQDESKEAGMPQFAELYPELASPLKEI
jgi:hypothetical protein